MSRNYATELKRSTLELIGITDVTPDGQIYTSKGLLRQQDKITKYKHYKSVCFYSADLRKSIPAEERTPSCGAVRLDVHRIVYCWFKGDIPAGMVVDHINNNSVDNRIENLQLITPEVNNNKDRKYKMVVAMPKKKKYTREQIVTKIEFFTNKLNAAKENNDQEACHKCRASIAQWKSRLRQFDANPELYQQNGNSKKELKEKLLFIGNYMKSIGNKDLWHYYVKWARASAFSDTDISNINLIYNQVKSKTE